MRILIVDDSKAMRMIVLRSLRQAGFTSHTFEEASDGASALKMLLSKPADLVLCDWNMPGMTGIELLKKLQEKGLPVKLGFVTSESSEEICREAEEHGALFLIAKPFTADILETKLGPILG